MPLAFPAWIRITHFLNFLFLSLLLRSGLEILSAHPKLYWNDDCRLNSEWANFDPHPYPKDELFTADDQETNFPSWLALPGHRHWDLGRHWHFAAVNGWIATGAAMSPAVAGRFPRYIRLFHGRQAARSIHFICLCCYVVFFIGHISMVVLHGFRTELALITLGQVRSPDLNLALAVGLGGIAAVVAVHVLATRVSFRHPDWVQRCAERFVDPVRRAVLGHLASRQHYTRADISPFLWVNGRPPKEPDYLALAQDHFKDYVLPVDGLVERPLRLTLEDLRALPRQAQITKHNCIQGWSGVAEWAGVPLREIIKLCRPLPGVGDVVFWAYDEKSQSEPRAKAPGQYYGTIPMAMARQPQTLLAFELNGDPLPIEHGAPLRLRLETQYGFTMVKYIKGIQFVDSFRHVGKGRGGWPEDNLYRSREASI